MIRNQKRKIEDALWGFIIGDTYGAPYEFLHPIELPNEIKLTSYGTHNQPLGSWSDDTSLVLATIDSINKQNGIDIPDIKKRFSQWLNKGKYTSNGNVFDVGNTTLQAIRDNKPGHDHYSNGNGSLMRMLPIAIYTYPMYLSVDDFYKVVKEVSSLTHAHPISVNCCMTYVKYFHFLMNGEDKKEALQTFINLSHIQHFDKKDLDTKGYIKTTLDAAIWCFLNTDNYKDCITTAISLGYDTDTVAAIAGSLAGYYYGNVCDIDKILNVELAEKIIRKFVEDLDF